MMFEQVVVLLLFLIASSVSMSTLILHHFIQKLDDKIDDLNNKISQRR